MFLFLGLRLRFVGRHQVLGERPNALRASHLFFEQRQFGYMEVLVQVGDLVQILLLDLVAGGAHAAGVVGVLKEQKLIHNDVVHIDAALGQLLDQSLRFVQREELCDADAHKCSLVLERREKQRILNYSSPSSLTGTYWILELLVHLGDYAQHIVQLLGECVGVDVGHAQHGNELC